MDGKQYVVSQQGSPVLFEVWKWDTKTNFYQYCISSHYELESSFWWVVYVSLVELPLVIHNDFGVVTEEVGNAF